MNIHTPISKVLLHWRVIFLLMTIGLAFLAASLGLRDLLHDARIRNVVLEGDLKYLNKEQLHEELSHQFTGQFLKSTLGQIIKQVENHPWIADASVRRIWPDTLVVHITEQRPVAIYNDTQYLGQSGDLFEPPKSIVEKLPKLYGSLSEIIDIYSHFAVFRDRLIDFGQVVSVTRGLDQGWIVMLDRGIKLRLGCDDILGRLSRARDVMANLGQPHLKYLKEIDARYDNGVAITWETTND